MIPFERFRPEKKAEYDCFLQRCEMRGCEYSFANLCLWGRQYGAVLENHLLLFSHFGGKSVYPYPVGSGSVRPVLEALMEDAKERGIPFRLTCLTKADCEELETLYPGRFYFFSDRDSADYIYDIHRLASLTGKKLQAKRNHINRFLEANPQWRTEVITQQLLPYCNQLLQRWYAAHKNEAELSMEKYALYTGLANLNELELEGLLLFAGDTPVALSLGSRLNETVFDVHFEKADADIPGAYPLINREFARYIQKKYPEIRYFNREDDMGLPGLRRAKESYTPDLLLEQYWAVWVEESDYV